MHVKESTLKYIVGLWGVGEVRERTGELWGGKK